MLSYFERRVDPYPEGTPVAPPGGLFAFPGFVDSHVHLTGVGLREMTLNLDQVKSVGPDVLGLSALLTTTLPEMQKVMDFFS